MHITRAPSVLRSAAVAAEQLQRTEHLMKKDKTPELRIHPSRRIYSSAGSHIILFMLFYKAWNPWLTKTFNSDYVLGCPEVSRTVAEPVFLTVQLGHSPRVCHKEVKAVLFTGARCPAPSLSHSWTDMSFTSLIFSWKKLAKVPASYSWEVTELRFQRTWRNTGFDKS